MNHGYITTSAFFLVEKGYDYLAAFKTFDEAENYVLENKLKGVAIINMLRGSSYIFETFLSDESIKKLCEDGWIKQATTRT